MQEPEIRFLSPKEIEEQKIKKLLGQEGGIVFETQTDPETKEEKNIVNILGVSVETNASKEDIEAIKNEMIMTKLDKILLRRIVECYKLKQPLLFEGDPGAGKTYLAKKFIQMIHGKDAPMLEIVGTPKTTELDILGHWAPKGLKGEDEEKYQDFLQNQLDSEEMTKISEEFNKKLEELNKKFEGEEVEGGEFQDEFGKLSTDFINKQKDLMQAAAEKTKFGKDSDWEFKEGALLKAYAGNEGKGYILIVDEFNSIPSNYQQIFLQISGKEGAMSDSVSFWGNAGKTVYERGEDTWIFFASNFPEKTPGRSEVVAPMSDRLVWEVIPDIEYQQKRRAIKLTAGGRLTKRKKEIFESGKEIIEIPVEEGIEWDKVLDEKLGEQIADIVDILDEEFVDYYQQVGDSISLGKEERRRTQKLEFSGRNPLRLFSYLDHFQVRNPETGEVDFTETLRNAYDMYYVGRLSSSRGREKMQKLFKEVLVGDTGKTEFGDDKSKQILNYFNQKNIETIRLLDEDKERLEADIENENIRIKIDLKIITKNEKISELLTQDSELAKELFHIKSFEEKEQELKSFFNKIKLYIQKIDNLIKEERLKLKRKCCLDGVKTRKEILDYLVKNINNPISLESVPKIEYKPYKLPTSVNTIDFNKPIVSTYNEMFSQSLDIVFKDFPINSLIIEIGNEERRDVPLNFDKNLLAEMSFNEFIEKIKKILSEDEYKIIGRKIVLTDNESPKKENVSEMELEMNRKLVSSLRFIDHGSFLLDFKKKIDYIEKYLSVDDDTPIVLVSHEKENQILNISIDKELKGFLGNFIEASWASDEVMITKIKEKMEAIAQIGEQFKRVVKNKNVIFRNIGELDLLELKKEILNIKVASLIKNKEVLLFSQNTRLKESFLRILETKKGLKKKIVNSRAVVIDLLNYDNKEAALNFVKEFTNKEWSIILLSSEEESLFIDNFPKYKELKETKVGKDIKFINVTNIEELSNNIEMAL